MTASIHTEWNLELWRSALQNNSDFMNKIEANNLILVLRHVSLEREVIATEYYFERRTYFWRNLGYFLGNNF